MAAIDACDEPADVSGNLGRTTDLVLRGLLRRQQRERRRLKHRTCPYDLWTATRVVIGKLNGDGNDIKEMLSRGGVASDEFWECAYSH